MSIGRDPLCDIELHDEVIALHHASIELDADGCFLTDAGSLSGTFVNEVRTQRRLLQPGDQLRIGKHVLKFLTSDDIESRYQEETYQQLTCDSLTLACNKLYFEDAFRREALRANRHHRALSLIVLDCDHFKRINAEFGHLVGDECLREMCDRVRTRVRTDELFARIGGEKFAILLSECPLPQAIEVANEVRRRVAEQPYGRGRGKNIRLTVSVALAHSHGDIPTTVESLQSTADRRLAKAKAAGRNCVAAPRS